VVEQAIETAGLMLGTDKSRGYCLEMICADFLRKRSSIMKTLKSCCSRLAVLQVPPRGKEADTSAPRERENVVNQVRPKQPRLRLDSGLYEQLRNQVLRRDGWRCKVCGAMSNLEVHHQEFPSQTGDESSQNLITLCSACHATVHHDSAFRQAALPSTSRRLRFFAGIHFPSTICVSTWAISLHRVKI